MSDTLSEVFDLEPLKPQRTEIISKEGEVIEPPDDRIEKDFDVSRNNLNKLLVNGHSALEHALEVAKSSEHPRAFEVVGNMIKQLADVNQQLMDLHSQKKKLEDPNKEASKQASKTVNNNLFVGTTSDLNKLLKDLTKGG
jgi:hypothetical protein